MIDASQLEGVLRLAFVVAMVVCVVGIFVQLAKLALVGAVLLFIVVVDYFLGRVERSKRGAKGAMRRAIGPSGRAKLP